MATPEQDVYRCAWGREESPTPFPWRTFRDQKTNAPVVASLPICDECWEKRINSGEILIDDEGAYLSERQ